MGRLEDDPYVPLDFLEVTPEHWTEIDGRSGYRFRSLAERRPLVCQGLSLNIGAPAPLDEAFLRRLKDFLDEFRVHCYSEQLSYRADDGNLHVRRPIAFTEDAIHHVAARVRRAQSVLERRIALRNVSYYGTPDQEMSELEFLNAVLAEADCDLLLDVANLYGNSVNHGYDPIAFLAGLPTRRITYGHIAGYSGGAGNLVLDTRGAAVIDPVWALLEQAYALHGCFPTVLECDSDIPSLAELIAEIGIIRTLQGVGRPEPRAQHAGAARH